MEQLPFIAAIDAGIHQEMRRDPSVLYFGQNLATSENHEFVAAYGHDRVRVTPISETAEIGIAIGAAKPLTCVTVECSSRLVNSA